MLDSGSLPSAYYAHGQVLKGDACQIFDFSISQIRTLASKKNFGAMC